MVVLVKNVEEVLSYPCAQAEECKADGCGHSYAAYEPEGVAPVPEGSDLHRKLFHNLFLTLCVYVLMLTMRV